jgi:hypothetical protein
MKIESQKRSWMCFSFKTIRMENRHLFAFEEVSAVPLAHIYDGALPKAARPQKAAHRPRVEAGLAATDCVNIDMFSLWYMCGPVIHVYDDMLRRSGKQSIKMQ